MSASFIKQLNEDVGRLHKEDVLKQALTAAKLGNDISHRFLCYLKACYNPHETFGVKKIPNTIGIADAENPVNDFDQLLEDLAARRLTGNDARDAIQELAERFDSIEWNTFYAPVLRRDMRSGISATTINKIVKGTIYEIPVFGCQLATNNEGRPEMRGTKRLEPKLDGVRVLMVVNIGEGSTPYVSATSYSRNGKVFENFRHIEEQIVKQAIGLSSSCKAIVGRALNKGFVLDGEVVGNSFQELMRQARRKEDVNADDSVFHVFDILPLADFRRGHWNAQLCKRLELLEAMRPTINQMPNVELLPHSVVDLDTHEGKSQFDRYCQNMLAAGFEGVMIKNLDAPYVCSRSTDWMKYKPVYDYDLTVIGVEPGTGKHTGRMGALVCEGEDSGKHIVVNVGSGYTDVERQEYWDFQNDIIGRTAVVLADAITLNQNGTYSLRFPRFARFRDDK